MSVISLRTTGNIEASNFSNDRNIDNRYWSGDLAELLIYNTALTDEQIADVERRLGYKWGLQDDLPPVLTDTIDSRARRLDRDLYRHGFFREHGLSRAECTYL